MRPFIYTVGFCLLLLVVAFSSCQKESLYTPTMTGNIDSTSFVASGATSVYCDTADSTGLIHVHGYSYVFTPGKGVRPVLELDIPARTGTYTIGYNCSASLSSYLTGKGVTAATSGSIIVTGVTEGRIEGTFSFSCKNGQQVSKGQFYTTLPKL